MIKIFLVAQWWDKNTKVSSYVKDYCLLRDQQQAVYCLTQK